jgi:hypothetical protein
MFRLRPLAVGLIALPRFAEMRVRRQARLLLTERAEAEGFAIAEIFEIDGRPVKDEASLTALAALSERIGARTVLAFGPLEEIARDRLTGEAQLTLLSVSPPERPADQ